MDPEFEDDPLIRLVRGAFERFEHEAFPDELPPFDSERPTANEIVCTRYRRDQIGRCPHRPKP